MGLGCVLVVLSSLVMFVSGHFFVSSVIQLPVAAHILTGRMFQYACRTPVHVRLSC